jgi:hypothetical protein
MLVKDTFSYFLELFNIMLWLFENGIGTYSGIGDLRQFWLSCLDPLVLLLPKL